MLTHVALLPPRARPPIIVEVHGTPRDHAAAKDSEWVRKRVSLEASKPADVEECLLSSGDLLYEGTQTNFFAVEGGTTVVTADERILEGTIRALVLEACAAEGIPVRREPPALSGIGSWSGAFLTSTSRLVLPIDEIRFGGKHPAEAQELGTAAAASVKFQACPLVQRIEALVGKLLPTHCTLMLPA